MVISIKSNNKGPFRNDRERAFLFDFKNLI